MSLPEYVVTHGYETLDVTPGEYRVLDAFLTDGADNATVSRRCFIGEETVKTHMRRMCARVDLTTRTELAVAVLTGRVRVRRVEHRPGFGRGVSRP